MAISRRRCFSSCTFSVMSINLSMLVSALTKAEMVSEVGTLAFGSSRNASFRVGFFLNGTVLTNLHTIWDVEIINTRIERHFQSNVNLYYDYLRTLMLNQSSMVNETYNDYQAWIEESVKYVCQQVYLDDNGNRLNVASTFHLGEAYFNRNWPVVDQRLAQAGRRLAALLDRLAEGRPATKLPQDVQALIVMLCIALVIIITAGVGMFLYYRQNPAKVDLLLPE